MATHIRGGHNRAGPAVEDSPGGALDGRNLPRQLSALSAACQTTYPRGVLREFVAVTTHGGRPNKKLVEKIERDRGAIRRALRVPLETDIARGGLTPPQLAVVQTVARSTGVSL